MISKKKLTALAVASLFVTPVMAGTSNNVWKNEISNQGSMTVGDEDFKKAAEMIWTPKLGLQNKIQVECGRF